MLLKSWPVLVALIALALFSAQPALAKHEDDVSDADMAMVLKLFKSLEDLDGGNTPNQRQQLALKVAQNDSESKQPRSIKDPKFQQLSNQTNSTVERRGIAHPSNTSGPVPGVDMYCLYVYQEYPKIAPLLHPVSLGIYLATIVGSAILLHFQTKVFDGVPQAEKADRISNEVLKTVIFYVIPLIILVCGVVSDWTANCALQANSRQLLGLLLNVVLCLRGWHFVGHTLQELAAEWQMYNSLHLRLVRVLVAATGSVVLPLIPGLMMHDAYGEISPVASRLGYFLLNASTFGTHYWKFFG